MSCKHMEFGICGKEGACLSQYCEEKVPSNAQPKALHLADDLEQERKKHKLQVLQLIDAIEDLMYWDNGKPEWEDARDLIKEIREKNDE